MIQLSRKEVSQSKKRLRKRQGERKELLLKIQEEIRSIPNVNAETTDSGDNLCCDQKESIICREALPVKLLQELIEGIITNRTALFGLRKLAKYDLNLFYPYPEYNCIVSEQCIISITWSLPKGYLSREDHSDNLHQSGRISLMLFAIFGLVWILVCFQGGLINWGYPSV